MVFTIIIFVFTLTLLVTIHELGHYLTARKFNIKALEFGFGLPPRIWGKQIGETLWSINWLPIGGFVRLLGEDEVDPKTRDHARSFAAQSVKKRVIVVVAGVTMNLVLAWVLFWGILAVNNFKVDLPLLTPHKFALVDQQNESIILIGSVSKGSPAEVAGIQPGDRIVALNDHFINTADELIAQTKALAGQSMKVTVSDPDKTSYRNLTMTPRVNPPKGEGAIGVGLSSVEVAHLEYKEWWQKALAGPAHSYNIAVYSFEILGQTIGQSAKSHDLTPISDSVAGPVGITSVLDQLLKTKTPFLSYLNFLAAISLNLAIVNILPFPGLDGGRLLFLAIEGITRKKVNPTFEKYVNSIGLALLIGLTILITFSDIKKLI